MTVMSKHEDSTVAEHVCIKFAMLDLVQAFMWLIAGVAQIRSMSLLCVSHRPTKLHLGVE